jgi:hypothetical protein
VHRIPFVIAALAAGTGMCWAVHLVVAPEPFAADSALALAIGTVMFTIIAVTALLLGRGRWARLFAMALICAELLIAVVSPLEPWSVAGIALSGLTLTGLGGPWLRGWLRQRPAAGAPGPVPMALALGAVLVVPLVGIAAPAGLRLLHGVAGAAGILFGWAYARAKPWALWALRIGFPPLLAAAAFSSPPGGAALLLLAAAGIGYLAWNRNARLAVDPLPTGLPSPRRPRR